MKLVSLNCPNCGAPIEIEDGINTFYCKYCGHKVVLSDIDDSVLNAKMHLKDIEHAEKMQDKRDTQERYKIESKNKSERTKNKQKIILGIIGVIGCIIFLTAPFLLARSRSDNEEQKLQNTVDEIMVDIENENFEDAYVKANSLYYTAGWSDDIKEKWDRTRESVIKQIENAEKESKGENNDNGFWDWFN